MFLARDLELSALRRQINSSRKTAVLVYGQRRIGKTAFIKEASKDFTGVIIHHRCTQSTYEGNLIHLGRSVCRMLGEEEQNFQSLKDIFLFLKKKTNKALLVLDSYELLKNSRKKNEADLPVREAIDELPASIKLIICGSYCPQMTELLEEKSPLFGRFSSVIHLEELNYREAALFHPSGTITDRIEQYAIFGGSPFVLNTILSDATPKENIIKLLLPPCGVLRSYVEDILLREIQKAFDIRILELIGNGKKRYSELSNLLGNTNGLLDKQLKILIATEIVEKIFPINKPNDKKKQFYTIRGNLLRFYFTFIFGKEGLIEQIGEEAYFDQYIQPHLSRYIEARFPDIANEYLKYAVEKGRYPGVDDVGLYWYDNPRTKESLEFDCVLKRGRSYSVYLCNYTDSPLTLAECERIATPLFELPKFHVKNVGFLYKGGYSFTSEEYNLMDLSDFYALS